MGWGLRSYFIIINTIIIIFLLLIKIIIFSKLIISLFRGGDGGLGPTSAGGDAARGSGPVSRL